MVTTSRATLEDLYRVPEDGKAEIVDGKLVLMSPTGVFPGRAGGEIYFSLRLHEQETMEGHAVPDNVGFVVQLPHRSSFSPDAAWMVGDAEAMEFAQGAPVFAAEVRSKNDYGPQAEQEILRKIQDYFDAGTLVVWDVDLLGDHVIRKYTSDNPDHPQVFRRGDVADAEPAVRGWTMPVDRLFGK